MLHLCYNYENKMFPSYYLPVCDGKLLERGWEGSQAGPWPLLWDYDHRTSVTSVLTPCNCELKRCGGWKGAMNRTSTCLSRLYPYITVGWSYAWFWLSLISIFLGSKKCGHLFRRYLINIVVTPSYKYQDELWNCLKLNYKLLAGNMKYQIYLHFLYANFSDYSIYWLLRKYWTKTCDWEWTMYNGANKLSNQEEIKTS